MDTNSLEKAFDNIEKELKRNKVSREKFEEFKNLFTIPL